MTLPAPRSWRCCSPPAAAGAWAESSARSRCSGFFLLALNRNRRLIHLLLCLWRLAAPEPGSASPSPARSGSPADSKARAGHCSPGSPGPPRPYPGHPTGCDEKIRPECRTARCRHQREMKHDRARRRRHHRLRRQFLLQMLGAFQQTAHRPARCCFLQSAKFQRLLPRPSLGLHRLRHDRDVRNPRLLHRIHHVANAPNGTRSSARR